MRRFTTLATALLLALPAGAQEPPPPAAAPSGGGGFAGSWAGWARLTNDWPGNACHYEGPAESSTVRLELSSDAGVLKGSIALDLPAAQGSGCPPLRKRYTVGEVVVGESTVSFTDSGGNEWNLSQRRKGDVLQGLLAWREGGTEQPLAEGFALPDGTRPGTRLNGEVRLRKETADASAPAEGETAAGGAKKSGGGSAAKNLVYILGANVVGLGLLYGANQLGKGTSSAGVVTCSPRNCVVGIPLQPCFCEGNVVSGSSCGSTSNGIPQGGACDLPAHPCQSSLSCNSGTCEDQFGRCPF